MTPAHTDSPLRRSEVGIFRDANANNSIIGSSNSHSVTINDDEEERRQARRRTILEAPSGDSGTFEDNETLKKCLEIYNGNKLSRDNAWSLSLIDTLSTLLDRHHKSLNNFKVAGSSLEASSKVYGLRVDSIHTDVLRMSAGLNAQKFNEQQQADNDDDDGDAAGGDANATLNATTADGAAPKQAAPKKPKRARKAVSTITKNKETLNARLDTVPLQDPVFGKLNSVVGSINSSIRLMSNILLTTDSELRLRTNFAFWDAQQLEACDYTTELTDELLQGGGGADDTAPCERLLKLLNYTAFQFRPMHSAYVISDTPEPIADDKEQTRRSLDSSNDGGGGYDDDIGPPADNEVFPSARDLSMAFDINAECEPMPLLSEATPMLDVDYADFGELTSDERIAINNCRGLRKAPVVIDDLRPVDASSKLEYSYRPLDKISQFWAGPSHWKFKRRTTRHSQQPPHGQTAQQQVLSGSVGSERNVGRALNQRAKRTAQALAKQRAKQLNFGVFHDELFLKLDDKYKSRKANIQKKWDQRKLKLPTDLQVDPLLYFNYNYAPGLQVEPTPQQQLQDDDELLSPNYTDDEQPMLPSIDAHFGDDDDCRGVASDNLMNISSLSATGLIAADAAGVSTHQEVDDCGANNTVLEIATEFEGAPSQVTKIIVPFAKRAKVIDMKSLKRCCSSLLNKQLAKPIADKNLPQHPRISKESYAAGVASFRNICEHLPDMLSHNMAESLSTSVAFYSVLHLSNDLNLRLMPQEDLDDFKIRQVML